MGTTEIEQIDANIIREKWMNPVFVDFVFWYSIRVSNNRKYIISRLLQENVSIFQCVTSSDIAWAVTCYVNNKDYWDTMMKTSGGDGGVGWLGWSNFFYRLISRVDHQDKPPHKISTQYLKAFRS